MPPPNAASGCCCCWLLLVGTAANMLSKSSTDAGSSREASPGIWWSTGADMGMACWRAGSAMLMRSTCTAGGCACAAAAEEADEEPGTEGRQLSRSTGMDERSMASSSRPSRGSSSGISCTSTARQSRPCSSAIELRKLKTITSSGGSGPSRSMTFALTQLSTLQSASWSRFWPNLAASSSRMLFSSFTSVRSAVQISVHIGSFSSCGSRLLMVIRLTRATSSSQ
mmetsp:Transcript_14740/g.57817  ORF Transcript_14740/g.57817 Transcript_14740/m.57817 type:complete len:225 (-) Transcript_14740:260-934(-)